MIARQTGATLCAMARCPNRLGVTPYRYCADHLPPVYREKAERYAERGDPRKARVGLGDERKTKAQQTVLSLLSDGQVWNRQQIRQRTRRLSDDTVGKALAALLGEGRIIKLKLGTYQLTGAAETLPRLLDRGGARVAILSALQTGAKSKAELRRAAPASFSTFRDSLEKLLRQRQIRRVAVGVYACIQ